MTGISLGAAVAFSQPASACSLQDRPTPCIQACDGFGLNGACEYLDCPGFGVVGWIPACITFCTGLGVELNGSTLTCLT